MGSVTFSADLLIGVVAFFLQGAALYGAMMWRTSKIEAGLQNVQDKVEEHSDLALTVERLDATLKRAVRDIEGIMERFGRSQEPAPSLAGIPADVLARVIFDMAKPK